MWIHWILIPVTCYIIGSIPFGALISRGVASIDITRRGSGNIGATNVAREVGLTWGLVTLVLDLLKGFLPVLVFYIYFYHRFDTGLFMVALSTLLGHQYSVFLRFHGGKGVATSLGIFLAVSPISAFIAIIVFIITVYSSDYVSLGSMVAAWVLPVALLVFKAPGHIIAASLIIAALICIKHRENIRRLFGGEERRWRKSPSCQKVKEPV